jgi:hypothetical protein
MMLGACATAAPPVTAGQAAAPAADPPPATPPGLDAPTRGAEARDVSRQLLSGLADQVVEIRRLINGPGYFLSGLELWERPAAAPYPGLCGVTVHRVGLEGLDQRARFQPNVPLRPPARASSVATERRFRAVASTVRTSAQPTLTHGSACEVLQAGSGFFTAPSDGDAFAALQAFETAQRWAGDPRAGGAGVECTTVESRPCADGPAILARLFRTEMITAVRRTPCEGDLPCWEFDLSNQEAGPAQGLWTVSIQRLNRPMRIILRQFHPPVV